MKIDFNTILIILLALFIWLFPNKESNTIIQPKIVEVETRIKDSVNVINVIKEKVKYKTIYLDSLYNYRDTVHDTIRIIQIQDTIINVQKNVIIKQDTIINKQDNVILLKDSVIALERIKRRKQRNNIIKLSLVALGTSIIAIIK